MNATRATLVVLVLCALFSLPGSVLAQSGAYVVQKGDTLNSIAARFGTTVQAIMETNGLANANTIWAGQHLTIPGHSVTAYGDQAAVTRVPMPVPLFLTPEIPPPAVTRVPVPTAPILASTAGSVPVPTAAFPTAAFLAPAAGAPAATAGGLAPEATGIPVPTEAIPLPAAGATPSPTATSANTRYTVKAGDTLTNIAARSGVSAAAIARANNLTNPDLLRLGMQLVIPGPTGAPPTPVPAGTATSAGAPVAEAAVDGALAPVPTATAAPNLRFVATISTQSCVLYNGNKVEAEWRCSTGRRGAPTLPGTYKVRSKMPRAWGATWGFWMPYWLGIYMAGTLENGIHGLPYSGNGVKVWQNSVGTPVTFGCVLLDDTAAKTLYDMAYIGMPVVILR
jgi:LysM repeat protein